MKKILSEEKLAQIRTDALFAKFVEEKKASFASFEGEPIPSIPYSLFRLFEATGERAAFEKPYFARRRLLVDATLLLALTHEEKYKVRLEDVMWAISDEFSWALPAHLGIERTQEGKETSLDLFASETASSLAIALNLVGDLLEEPVVTRVRREIRRRVIDSFLTRTFDHEHATNNWAAVCACGIAVTFMLEATREEFDRAYPRFDGAIRSFLSGYGKDACCTEGVAYWNYGFGSFSYYAEALRLYTGGKVDWFRDEFVHRCAKFPDFVRVSEGRNVSFSDASGDFVLTDGVMHLLSEKYADVPLPDARYLYPSGTYWFVPTVAYLLFAKEKTQRTEKLLPMTAYFEEASWFIKRTKKYSFCAKGGHNDEPHNHNDLGNFTLEREGEIFFADLGCPQYTKQYFNEERYTYVNANSGGHSVPIIGTHLQKEGRNYAAKTLSHSECGMSLELSGAYEAGVVDSLVRTFVTEEDGVTVSDAFSLPAPESVTERFITLTEPHIDGQTVHVGHSRLSCGRDARIVISTDTAKKHGGIEYTFWKVDFIFDSVKTLNVKFSIKI